MGKSIASFSILLLLLLAGLRVDRLLFAPPMGDHAWAQCDRASVALNYYQELNSEDDSTIVGRGFWYPKTHNAANNPSRIAAGEFPAEPYWVAHLYRLFGFHEYLFRGSTLLFSLLGFYFAFLIAARHLRHPMLQVCAASLWLFSPNLIYFSCSFLPDGIALAFFTIGLYFVLENDGRPSNKAMLIFALFGSWAMLLKSSVAFLYGIVWLSIFIQNIINKDIRKAIAQGLALCVPVGIAACWIWYAKQSQQEHHSYVFRLNLFLPGNLAELTEHCKILAHNLTKFYTPAGWLTILIMLFFFFKHLNIKDFIAQLALGSLVSWALFTLLMLRNASHHGYYHVPFFLSIFLLSLAVFKNLERNLPPRSTKPFSLLKSKAAMLQLMFISLFFSANLYFFQKKAKEMAYHTELLNPDWYTAQTGLRSLGIKPIDKVFSCPDRSYNNSLYLLDQRGWTAMPGFRTDYLERAILDCQYAVLGDTGILADPVLRKYFDKKMGTWGSLSVYKIVENR